MKPHILLLDEKTETRGRIKFLLSVSGYMVTDFPNREDAVNWISNAGKTPLSFDLLLVNYLDSSEQSASLVELFDSLGQIAPILLLSRSDSEKYSTDHIDLFRAKDGYFTCFPESMIEKVNSLVINSRRQASVANSSTCGKAAHHV